MTQLAALGGEVWQNTCACDAKGFTVAADCGRGTGGQLSADPGLALTDGLATAGAAIAEHGFGGSDLRYAISDGSSKGNGRAGLIWTAAEVLELLKVRSAAPLLAAEPCPSERV